MQMGILSFLFCERTKYSLFISLFLFRIVDEYGSKGLPTGNQTSQCFGLLYLDEADRLIKERFSMKYYSRYMDDGITISNDKEILIHLHKAIGSAYIERSLIAKSSKKKPKE